MKFSLPAKLVCLLLICVPALAQKPGYVKSIKGETYFDPSALRVSLLIPLPPASGSAAQQAELAEMHRIEQARTPAQVAAARADEHRQNIFAFNTVLGEEFNAKDLPLTAALSTYVYNEEPALTIPLKGIYARPRPYQYDHTLHPVCGTTTVHNSYPSGHSLSGYLEAFTLIQMVPEKSQEILARADEFAHNRLVCGVHYPSDIATGREIAYALFGYMMAMPQFQRDLAAARAETRRHLGLN